MAKIAEYPFPFYFYHMDWTRFVQRIAIRADRNALYHQLASRKGMEHWFLRKAEFFQPDGSLRDGDELVSEGDTYSWLWHGYGDEVEEKGKILAANGQDFIQFTFADPCIVSVRMQPEKNLTILELIQENIPIDDETKMKYYVGCSTGWVFYLANLKSLMEGGLDLRNKSLELGLVLNS